MQNAVHLADEHRRLTACCHFGSAKRTVPTRKAGSFLSVWSLFPWAIDHQNVHSDVQASPCATLHRVDAFAAAPQARPCDCKPASESVWYTTTYAWDECHVASHLATCHAIVGG